MYKMIVCDLDETLMSEDGTLSDKNTVAIKAATKKGVYFVPNSGRSYTSFQNDLQTMGLYDQENQYSISYNGGLISENKGNRPLVVNAMDYDLAKQVFEIGIANPKADTHVYTQDKLFIFNTIADDAAYLKNRGVTFEEMSEPNFEQFKNLNIMKIIMDLPTMELRKQMQADVEAEVDPSKLAVTYSSDRYVEFNPAGIDKGSATLQLAQKLGIKPEEVIAAGDNGNDLPMLKVVGLPVSVANGIDSVKSVAKYVTEADNNHDALAEVINKFVL
ncbi:Cof-type HAD-IIB family hydrolase [Companilactobacillus sp.]|jgi:Cof subfamily protein (haloacid dehalogenase superfamily)|uniref:Cof-type HAD-IIB family hydrolase n=1 Tax=Companilactobacillus sp. TaxID=2767905 RepID=UPI0025B85E31|nr:Cof-type HAD-IIB family hydrolase [Companilactobacillus sp.]MCH4008189.1 Cof-type HAD-IIB family hydrolase [Companilactobacillus sp.]MCH4051632.1 Cof-type HAD-IIB family hydrolase [Companilactobacillus sp.]MCH4076132.1 Cof-type HAD-IIB family hydrolase [Companilactobacillus sp.]MCH4124707.1 Cof-type HAD-IIB family hydrolase [Companilactobacillus sp.]MCH4131249.1 Cof-type HAD-IIB family hydrolase [Companilactobacillus sp.]